MSTTIRVEFDKSREKANGEVPLYLCVTKNRKKKRLSLGISVKAKHWDFDKELPKKNCPNKDEIEKIIAEKKLECGDKQMEFKAQGKDFTSKTLVESVKNPIKPMTVQALFDECIVSFKEENRLNYSASFRYTLNKALEFNKHLEIPFSDIDVAWCKKFERWMRSKELKNNTIGLHFRNLRALFNLAIEKKYVKRDYYPFDNFNVSKLKNDTLKRALTKKEVMRIMEYAKKHDTYLSSSPNVSFEAVNTMLAIDLFIFSYLVSGINFNDIANLTKKNIIDNRTNTKEAFAYHLKGIVDKDERIYGDYLSYQRKKTQKLITQPLTSIALNLINKYADKDNPYLFPILNAFHKTEQQKANRIHKMIGKINKCLKTIGNELDIPIDLTTYVARHSFATVLKRSGVHTGLISEALGHSNEKITQTYLDSFGSDQMRDAMKNLLLDDTENNSSSLLQKMVEEAKAENVKL